MESDLTGRRAQRMIALKSHRKMTSQEEYLIGRQPQGRPHMKMSSQEVDLERGPPHRKTNSQYDDLKV